ncbi:ribonuclease H-like domain-containing protein [Schizothecium vesticola]|uniref:Ribonuclease H-like domain-containing protein n=1 Tax=Schizothecium vesticola TaxID=314040 RepID=A0AA40K8P1_9PEZI|nr:ribonuclease H-like domain-containing protein [Schizothecium vesticola]
MESSQDFAALRESIQKALVTTTRTVNGLANEDLQFQRTAHRAVGQHLDDKSDRFLRLATDLLQSAGKFTGQNVSKLEDADDVDIRWRSIVDVIDGLLEKADTCLDEYTGLIKRKGAPTAEPGRDAKRPKSTSDKLDWSMKRANIVKPQDAFEKKVDNSDLGPWKPLLTQKPHAKVSLEDSLQISNDGDKPQYRHPYQTEITDMEYPRRVFEKAEPKIHTPIESTKAIWVDTYEGVLEMLEELKRAPEIAVDLEHHDFRSYVGLLSLMQISTRDKDWIVDTLVPWRHKLEVLNEVFADPSIIKVLHGAFMDVVWLQRDLGLYLVGLFDTYWACRALDYPGKSLAYLLGKFVDFEADKKYQLADWRIRPLPEEMFYYARSDTHFLLYIFDKVRNELIDSSVPTDPERDLMRHVLNNSKEVALQRYEVSIYDPDNGHGGRGWYNNLVKSPVLYDGEQFAVYKAVHKWRDDTARARDESPLFIMNQQAIADIASMLPSDKKALWSLLDKSARGLKNDMDELFAVIQAARKEGINGPTMMDIFRGSPSSANQSKPPVKAEVNIPDIQELKVDKSQFWGPLPLSSAWDGSTRAPASDDKVEIVLTYPRIVDEENDDDLAEHQLQNESSSGGHETAPEAQTPADEEFTLKKTGRKRKVDDRDDDDDDDDESETESEFAPADAESGSEMDVDEAASDVADGEAPEASTAESSEAARLARNERKKLRKIKKKAKREAKTDVDEEARAAAKAAKKARKAERKAAKEQQSTGAEEEGEEEEQAFDYSKAASVLNASKPTGEEKRGGKNGKGKKTFDPYSNKSGDAPKGERRLGLVKSGKTATFKK